MQVNRGSISQNKTMYIDKMYIYQGKNPAIYLSDRKIFHSKKLTYLKKQPKF